MDTAPLAPSEVAAGDILLRKSLRWGLIALLALALTTPCLVFIKPLWRQFSELGPGSFKLLAATWAHILAAGPILLLGAGLTSLFLRVEACCAPRSKPAPIVDGLAIGLGLLISFAPALAALYPPAQALQTGLISFHGPGQDYPLDADPYGYWQGIAFWLMGSASLAYLACVYWRSRWKLYRQIKRNA